jgi:hypothetical protein
MFYSSDSDFPFSSSLQPSRAWTNRRWISSRSLSLTFARSYSGVMAGYVDIDPGDATLLTRVDVLTQLRKILRKIY